MGQFANSWGSYLKALKRLKSAVGQLEQAKAKAELHESLDSLIGETLKQADWDLADQHAWADLEKLEDEES